ncbi:MULTISPECIES: DUF3800 domain-containing protein [unclassified Pseudoxanthomonas]|uniref:DUF3800 domain-containing protein n=1 Tax=unclassified Pseudoxanthomonas TaxID=2645906 RepID=UPI00160E862D|nr:MULTISPECIES: DUF3800 domain-containing protein [unclassified Pseudoxanthomonas]MBB3275078.1 hypothetical protein [Pseudoxanthomonas sp. OG2]MBV7473830.1 DUF3800 domain-containing protein [Pseudoxanthomonas sp. PXM05]
MENPGVRSWLISCDESGVHGSTHYGFGSLWMRWQRRGDFYEYFRDLRDRHRFRDECKWKTANSERDLPFYEELISDFFKRRWLAFHCLVVRKQIVRKEEFHNNSWDLARRKHYTMLITDKIKRSMKPHRDREHEFRVYVDPIPSSYQKADEAIEVISNNVLNKKFSHQDPVRYVQTRDSKETPTIQVCDLLLGAVMETWNKKATNPVKHKIRKIIASHLGWRNLDADTFKEEKKFNIWYFHDPLHEKRSVVSREVKLKYPY